MLMGPENIDALVQLYLLKLSGLDRLVRSSLDVIITLHATPVLFSSKVFSWFLIAGRR